MVLAILGNYRTFNSRSLDGVDMVGSTMVVSEWGGGNLNGASGYMRKRVFSRSLGF
jgi:hypothetical protein